MTTEAYIQFRRTSSGANPVYINRGELVYFLDIPRANAYFEALLGNNPDNSLEVHFNSKKINDLSANESLYNRRKIAYVSDQLALLETMTVDVNVNLYCKSIGKTASKLVTQLFQAFNLDASKRILDLSELDEYLVRIAIGLAKEPEVLILNNPYAQIDPASYTKIMDMIYELILEHDMTCLCCLSSKYLSDQFPGRVID